MKLRSIYSFLQKIIDSKVASLLVLCFVCFSLLSWILLLRDGQGLYGIIAFYTDLFPFVLWIEPYLIPYGINSIPTLLFIGLTILSFFCYYRSLFLNISLKKTVLFAVLFQGIMFFSYPALSTDIFSYIFSDRIATVYHQNVWKTKPIEYDSDKFSRLADWKNQTKVYGGINQVIYNGASTLAGNNLFLNVFFYKLIAWVFALFTMYVVYLITKEFYKGKESINLRFLFWNPLVVLEILGSGHNDIIMIFFTLLAFLYILRKYWITAGVFLAMAVQIKIIPIFLFLFLCIHLLRQKNLKSFSLFIVPFSLINFLVFRYMDVDPFSFAKRLGENNEIYWQSLQTLFYHYFPGDNAFFTVGFVIVLIGSVVYQLWRNTKPLDTYAFFLLFYLLFITSAYWNWYVLWILTLVPFLRSARLIKTILLLSFTSTLAYPLYWLSLRFGYQSTPWLFITPFVILGIPAIMSFFFTDKKLLKSEV